MRLRSVLLVPTVAGAALVPTAGVAHAADKDCADFSSQAQAQAWFDTHPGDPDRLDRDRDGQACEDYTGYPSTSDSSSTSSSDTASMPQGGVRTGSGGLAEPEEGSAAGLPIGFGAAAVLAAGAAVALRRGARRDG
ncbi:calcium-binding protein [Streptomyces sp. SID8379]|uniref:excalibur calcium-binding domain-containing protein n=1 Tax=unclassified Streptomyces TaxID=2593676 RepID=UPI0003689D35|nr:MULTISPECIES: excalibur calcium-binding domain-containing protein [unclassified Streptomyces]MYW70486.1 calcium-binding protein [Streptomyces sp. SID8379]